jgi:hypothetical protein
MLGVGLRCPANTKVVKMAAESIVYISSCGCVCFSAFWCLGIQEEMFRRGKFMSVTEMKILKWLGSYPILIT